MLYYYKLITKQDLSRSFVINKKAVDHFFSVQLIKHGDEAKLWLKYECNSYEETRIVLHQDVRLLLKKKDFSIGNVAFFKNNGDNKFELEIISSSNNLEKVISKLNSSNFYLSNTKIEL
jgi:hypothetical protein